MGHTALEVSANNLSGGIPEFLVNFRVLNYLNISFNNFEGVIPSEGVFKNASAIFVEGNNNLCGGNRELNLSKCSGSFGSVYKGILRGGGPTVAIKVLDLLNYGASRSFLVECEVDRNLVKVLTSVSSVDYEGNDFKALVYEFMENGSLENWLHPSIDMNESETTSKMSFLQRVNLAIDVAHVLDYLHNDVFNSTNQSRSIGLSETTGYAPPEYGMGSKLLTRGDVYSYGVLLLEMAAIPHKVIEIVDPILLQEILRDETLVGITLNGNNIGNDIQLQCLNSKFEIGLICSADSLRERMDMSDVVSKLCSIRDKLPAELHVLLNKQGYNKVFLC
ncbi:probable LRR receptor-like serine/threonine-protein kinase At3g47570 [Hibiscus syriacus]|uniref:probable LRR receptor-like serine/threonine-protein kinase At3g47570 n=1 Tax=Hibiscus syriacus TaxID=106335 RepID=UPI0019244E8B|nr:probable LRR receptor-like serine/threonine-protein kinase At3g47570 [Hibiscus syriacus]